MKSTFSEKIVGEKQTPGFRQSLITVTINTNRSYKTGDRKELKEDFSKLLHDLFAKENLKSLLLDRLKPQVMNAINQNRKSKGEHWIYGFPLNSKVSEANGTVIKEIEAKTQIEANLDIRGFLHSHTIFKITHNSRIGINTNLIRNIANKYLDKYLKKKDGNQGSVYVKATGSSSAYEKEHYLD